MKTTQPTTVIHHSADFDGLFCREIARKFLPPDTILIGWDFADKPLDDALLKQPLIILDLPVDRPFGLAFRDGWICKGDEQVQPIDRWDSKNIIWIDHHKSSIETHPKDLYGYRLDGVAACRLAWQWFTGNHNDPQAHPSEWHLPTKEDFVERRVSEPFAVRLAGEYDIWDKRDPRAGLFQHGLRSMELTPETWAALLDKEATLGFAPEVQRLLMNGRAVAYAKEQENADIITNYGFTVEWEGLTFLACNHARFNSHLFTAGIGPQHDALMGFKWTGRDWSFSLYHAPGKEHHDLSLIAAKYGGGGHRGACGFSLNNLPFPTVVRQKK